MCVCVCLLPQNCCLSSIISKSEHATALNLFKKLAILFFYKTGLFLKAQATQTARKFEMKRLCNKTKASIDVVYDIWKIICEDLCRNVCFVSYDNFC